VLAAAHHLTNDVVKLHFYHLLFAAAHYQARVVHRWVRYKVFHRKRALGAYHLAHYRGVFIVSVIIQLLQSVVVANVRLYVVVIKAVVVLRGRIVVAFYPAYVAPGLRIYAPLYYKAIVVYLYRCRPCQLYVAVVHRFCLEVDHLYRQRGTMVAAMQPEFTELRYLQLNVVIARTSAEYAAELVRCLGQRTIRTARYAEVGAIYFVNTAAQVVGVAIVFVASWPIGAEYFVTNKSVSPVLSEKSSFCVHGSPGALLLLPRVAAFNSSASACVKYRRTPTGSPLVGGLVVVITK
jgi:hypothetical protein